MAQITVTIKEAPDFNMEQRLVEERRCDFAVLNRTDLFYVTTREEKTGLFKNLPGWTLRLNSGLGSLKRFEVSASKEEILLQLESIYGKGNVLWLS